MSADVAVLMAAYNAEKTLRVAVDSILASTVACDLYLVDDCSRIPVEQVIGRRDNVTIIRLPKNHGLAAALNIGLEHILPRNYKYFARMDADDVSYPHRFATQIAFLERNPEVALVGSGARFIDDRSGAMVMYYVPPLEQEDIRKALFFNNCFVHPTWMIRGEALASLVPYSLEYPAAEDYEFLRRAITHAVVANVPDILVDYRISTGGISVSKRQRQLLDRLALQVKYLEPTQWRAWAGMAKTVMLFAIPRVLVTTLKAEWRSWHPPRPQLGSPRAVADADQRAVVPQETGQGTNDRPGGRATHAHDAAA
ncbi:MAG TPA: glycosyltransferase [Xanthobacteraceae bacterium]|nr:glycosyltransferase [Xanthobacteraceae bacterium]